ncbi:MAG: DUF6345 domain-containing protein [Promethearchaeota archaeon]
MRGKDAVLLLVLLVLICSTADVYNVEAAEYHRPPSYRLSAVMANVYRLITPEVNMTYASSQAEDLFSLRTTEPVVYQGLHLVNSGNRTFEIDSRDGSMFYADYSRYWNPSSGVGDMSPEAAKDIADAFLIANDLLPAGAFLLSIGNTSAHALNPDTEVELTKIMHYQVNYGFEVNGIPVTGPGAQIAVTISMGDLAPAIVAFDWNWRELEVVDTIPLIEFESLLAMHGILPGDVKKHSLAYYAGPDQENDDYLFPVYELEVEKEVGGETVEVFPKLSATEYTPVATITSPADGATFRADEQIRFNCSVVNGTAPYTFNWTSNYGGYLGNEAMFVTSYAHSGAQTGRQDEELTDNGGSLHTITLTVVDSNGMMSRDFITLTITPAPLIGDTALIVLVGVGVLVVLLCGLTSRRRGKLWSFLLLLALLAAFTMVPIVSAAENGSKPRLITPSAPSGDWDDGVKEVGIEWVGLTGHPPLPNTKTNIEGFYNWMGGNGGYNREFNWGEYAAYEQDFKYVDIGGDDDDWVDCVDFVYYQDHGNPTGVAFSSNHDDTWLHHTECRWGDGDLEWIVMDACSPLAWDDGAGNNVWERWTPALRGVHLILSFATGSNNVQTRGIRFGIYLTGLMFINKMSLVDAWFRACAETQGDTCYAAVLYASKSADPWNPQLDDVINDHAHGFGYQASDPKPGTFSWYVYITSQC